MSRVITFSTKYPSYYHKAGQPTMFVEKIWKGLPIAGEYSIWQKHPKLMKSGEWHIPHTWRNKMLDGNFKPKWHTIRKGNRWKAGMVFSPRIWSGQPYKSKQVVIAPDIRIEKTYKFEIDKFGNIKVNGKYIFSSKKQDFSKLKEIAKNDGLSVNDLLNWFQYPKQFKGQIIIWAEHIEY